MSPILGIWASQNYPRITGSYDSIATYSISSNTSSVTFSSLPTGYKHFQIRSSIRTDRSDSWFDALLIRVNNDSATSSYSAHYLSGVGTSAVAGNESGGNNGAVAYRLAGSQALASVFGSIVTDILDVYDTNKYKTIRSLGGMEDNTRGEIYLTSAAWLSTAAISSLVLLPRNGTNFVAGSKIALYGIKG